MEQKLGTGNTWGIVAVWSGALDHLNDVNYLNGKNI